MEKTNVIDALAALAQENRLDTYRLLVQAGADGRSAGEIAAALGLPPNTISFHFDRLRQVDARRSACEFRNFLARAHPGSRSSWDSGGGSGGIARGVWPAAPSRAPGP